VDLAPGGDVDSFYGITVNLYVTGVTISGLTIADFGAGVSVDYGASATIRSNTLSSNAYYGIEARGQATIAGNTINGSLDGGIFVYKSATIRGNDLHDDNTGIVVDERAEATILGNSITENQYGIQSLGDTTIGGASGGEGNTISSNAYAGIEVERGEATITHDALTRDGTGILVGSSATDTSVVSARENDLSQDAAGVTSNQTGKAHLVNATADWWGGLHGPTTTANAGGNGTSVSPGVDFSPWIGAYSNASTVGFDPTGIKLTGKHQAR
jgi:nitrous oxidase accessory protein NosD